MEFLYPRERFIGASAVLFPCIPGIFCRPIAIDFNSDVIKCGGGSGCHSSIATSNEGPNGGTPLRNAITVGDGFVVTTDNSGGIGEKPGDFVAVPDRVTSYFAARVALLEQWACHAEPVAILIHNFSGSTSWHQYVAGVTDLFQEAGLDMPTISGSSETNMELVQSAMAVTMIGQRRDFLPADGLIWFTYGTPLVGNEVLEYADQVASLRLIRAALDNGIVDCIWPVGSGGILNEVRKMLSNEEIQVVTELDTLKTAGPSTVVLLGIPEEKAREATALFGAQLTKIQMHT